MTSKPPVPRPLPPRQPDDLVALERQLEQAVPRCENCGHAAKLYHGWCLDCRFGDDP